MKDQKRKPSSNLTPFLWGLPAAMAGAITIFSSGNLAFTLGLTSTGILGTSGIAGYVGADLKRKSNEREDQLQKKIMAGSAALTQLKFDHQQLSDLARKAAEDLARTQKTLNTQDQQNTKLRTDLASVASSLEVSKKELAHLLSSDLGSQVESLQNALHKLEDNKRHLESALEKSESRAAKLAQEKIEAEQLLEKRRQELGVLDDAIWDRFDEEYKVVLSKLPSDEAKMAYKSAEIHNYLERLSEYADQVEDDNEGLRAELQKCQENNAALMADYEVHTGTLEQSVTQFGGKASAEIERLARQNQELNEKLLQMEKLSRAPKYFRGAGKAYDYANRIIDFFLSKGVTLDGNDVDVSYGQYRVMLFPRDPGSEFNFQKYVNPLKVTLGLTDEPKFDNSAGQYTFSFYLDGGGISVETSSESKNVGASSGKKTFSEPPPSKLENSLRENFHYRLVGPTGSGKSTAADNIINFKAQDMGCDVTIYDPKFPESDWPNRVPDYRGKEDCLRNIENVGGEVDKRLKACRKACEENPELYQNKRPGQSVALDILGYSPALIVVDESQDLYRYATQRKDMLTPNESLEEYGVKDIAKTCKNSLLTAMDTGRASGVAVVYIGQKSLCSKNGFNKEDFHQSLNIFLGSLIPDAIEDEVGSLLGKPHAAMLAQEYRDRMAEGQKYLMLVLDGVNADAWLQISPGVGQYAPDEAENKAEKGPKMTPAALPLFDPALPESDQNPDNTWAASSPHLGGKGGKSVAQIEENGKSGGEVAARGGVTTIEGRRVGGTWAAEAAHTQVGAHCTSCGMYSSSIKRSPKREGAKTGFNCLNDECDRKTFSAFPI